MKRFATSLIIFVCFFNCVSRAAPPRQVPVISIGTNGNLVYTRDKLGNGVPDFSTCGYSGGDKPVPNAGVKVVVSPIQGDETGRIQNAIDYVAGLPTDTNGLRGAVLLLKGRHEVLGGLSITNAGVVIRGQGMNEGGTLLLATGQDRRTLIKVCGNKPKINKEILQHPVMDDYAPVGSTRLQLDSTDGLKAGDLVTVVRPSSKDWIETLGMTEFGGGLGDWRLTWKEGTRDIRWTRTIQSVQGNMVRLDAPITTAIEKKTGGGYVVATSSQNITNIGIENVRLASTFDEQNPKDENHSWCAITFENGSDAWVRQVTFKHFAGSAVAIYETCSRMTVEDCISLEPVSEDAGYRRHTFFTMGQQTLFIRCYSEHGRHDFSVGHCAAGPNAFVECEATLPLGDSGSIESWASGILFDNVRIDGGGLSLMNRGTAGEGAGWSAANSVLWQCNASKITCENPPGAQNWALGCWGEFSGNGVWRNANSSVRPQSLFIAQVADRLGIKAADQIELMPRSMEEYSSPTQEQAAKMIAEAREPAPQLKNFIEESATSDPIPSNPGDAKQIEELTVPIKTESPAATRTISITNGWLVCDGRLLTGKSSGVNWWRGNIKPSEASTYGINLTRFTPGRKGVGLTDDLEEVADYLQAMHIVALDHHYGLWYDRRREDHERVRRIDGDVWPPFYEQPFARSGNGIAWDGLSKYDLTKFNPWYWSQLRQFAGICDKRGLVLFNENFFQHNILEAGAHWVDCPWRSANNINGTGFPEPPPFAGDKRVFMAEQFYDVTNPARRKLFEGFIRQNLNNFTNNANVIQFTSGEFTGPLAFEQFWLETIGSWEKESGHKALVALCSTKDVQDEILSDASLAAVVDVICFRYWWRSDKGLFEPKGGRNLTPRQFEHLWKGGPPSDMNLAGMTSEYRAKFPAKAVIASGEDAEISHGSWAFLCAGGSMPNIPQGTDAKLLSAIPSMQPWTPASSQDRWALRESGKQLLVYSKKAGPLDLSGETGAFKVHPIDQQTGKIKSGTDSVQASGNVSLPDGVVWLTRD